MSTKPDPKPDPVLDSQFVLPDGPTKRIGDMTRDELLVVIGWQMRHSDWQRQSFNEMAELAGRRIP